MLIKNRKGAFGDETATRMPQSANVEPAVRFTNLSDLDHDGDVDIVGEPGLERVIPSILMMAVATSAPGTRPLRSMDTCLLA